MIESVQLTAPAKVAVLRQALVRNPDSAAALYELSEALHEIQEEAESIELFRRAFALSPSACGAIANPGANPDADKGRRMRERARALIEHGIGGSPVIAALAVGESLCGNEEAVRWLVDYDRLFRVRSMEPPPGFAEFNGTLAAEIRSNLRYYDEPRNRSIRKGWRNDETTQSPLPASAALTAALRSAVEAYIVAIPVSADHPFPASRPAAWRIAGWAVVSDGSSYHKPHIHPEAWMSGVYYVVRPPVSREPGTDKGWMTVGPPEWGAPLSLPGWDSRLVEPEPGNLALMPGYFFHRTRPMGVDQERICVAFDVVPEDVAPEAAV